MASLRFVSGMALGVLCLAACTVPQTQPTNVGASAAAPVVPGTARIMGGASNADIQRTEGSSPGTGAPVVPGSVRIMGGASNAEAQRNLSGPGVQAPILRGTGQINDGISNAEVQRLGGGPPAR